MIKFNPVWEFQYLKFQIPILLAPQNLKPTTKSNLQPKKQPNT